VEVGFSLLTLSPGHPGGSETYVRGLLEGFARQPLDDRITVLADARVASAYADVIGARVQLTSRAGSPVGRRRLARAARFARVLVAPARPARELDVMHYPLTLPVPRTPTPSIVTLHDLNHRDLAALWGRAERTYRRVVYEGAARRAAVVVTPAEFTRRRVIDLLGADPSRVVAIPHGVDSRFTPAPAPTDGDLAPPEAFVLYPAADWPHKNHERLLRAFAAYAPPEVALVLTGNRGRRWERLAALAAQLGIAGRVRHLGRVDSAVLPALYRRAAALVFPSLYEGWGLPPLEAMACGCPVASSARGGLAEACGDAALPFDPEDDQAIGEALTRIVGDEALRTRLRERGLARAGGFTWERAARAHATAYRRALSG
jgi:glycosyltransferase involved in cell wall biosynthesis